MSKTKIAGGRKVDEEKKGGDQYEVLPLLFDRKIGQQPDGYKLDGDRQRQQQSRSCRLASSIQIERGKEEKDDQQMSIAIMQLLHEVGRNRKEDDQHRGFRNGKMTGQSAQHENASDDLQDGGAIPKISRYRIGQHPERRAGQQEKRGVAIIHHRPEREGRRIEICPPGKQRLACGIVNGEINEPASEDQSEKEEREDKQEEQTVRTFDRHKKSSVASQIERKRF